MTTYYAMFSNNWAETKVWLTAEECAVEWLTDDSGQFEIIRDPDGEGFWLWTKILHMPWGRYTFTLEENEDKAEADLLTKVFDDAKNDVDHGWFIDTMQEWFSNSKQMMESCEDDWEYVVIKKILDSALEKKPIEARL